MVRPCLFTLLALLTATAPASAQQLDMVWMDNSNRIELRFYVENDFLVLPVKMNDRRYLRFIIDTGAENTVLLDKVISDELDVDYRRKFEIRGADVTTPLTAYLATGIDLEFDERLLARNRSMLVLAENYLKFERVTGTEIHGILGVDFLSRFVVEIDYSRNRIVLHRPNRYRKSRKQIEIPSRFVRNRAYLDIPLAISTRQPISRSMLLDSGAGLPFLMHIFQDSSSADLPQRLIPTTIANGLGGELEGSVGRTSRALFLDRELNDVVTFFQPLPERTLGFLNGREGIIGNRVLNRFNVTIDYVRQRVYFRPNRRKWKQKFDYDRSGLTLTAGGKGFFQIIVANVLDGGPADRQKIRPGDKIQSINGIPSLFLSLGGVIRRLEGKAGEEVKIRILREGRLYDMVVVLEDLI